MGYTSYWYVKKNTPDEKIVEAGQQMIRVVEAGIDVVAGPMGYGDPVIDVAKGEVLFNGRDSAAHETFAWGVQYTKAGHFGVEIGPDDAYFHFCKTAQKPYDVVVVACLLVALKVLGDDITISSDACDLNEFLGKEISEGWMSVNMMLGHAIEIAEDAWSADELYQRVFGEAPPTPAAFSGAAA